MATVVPVASDDAARAVVDELRDEWPDASHHCSAWRLASPAIERANDDGEPGGSAGRPILAALTGRDVVDAVGVVTRWFGGTKLGVGGLVRAYGGAAAAALDASQLDEWLATTTIIIEHDHSDTGPVERALASTGAELGDVEWESRVRRSVTVPVAEVDGLWRALADATSGRIQPSTDDPD